MAVTRTGSPVEIDSSATSGSQAVTVPADCTFVAVGVSGHSSNTGFFTNGGITLGGQALSVVAADSSVGDNMAAIFYKASPLTGSQTLAWDWNALTPDQGVILVVIFYKGDNGTVRSSNGVQTATSTTTTGTLTAASGDLIICWWGGFWDASGLTTTWSTSTGGGNTPTKVADYDLTAGSNGAAASLAEASPTGNQTVRCVANHSSIDAGLVAIVLEATAVAATSYPLQRRSDAVLLVR